MKPGLRYSLVILGIVILLLALWYFQNIVAYILISAVLALIGKPIVELLGKIKVKNIGIPKAVRAFVALLLIWTVFYSFFRYIIPLIITEIDKLSVLNPDKIFLAFAEPIKNIEHIIDKYQLNGKEKFTIEHFITQKLISIFNASFVSNFMNSIAGLIGNIFIAAFSISFITFFFLRDDKLFNELVLAAVPTQYEESFKRAMNSTRHLLVRYFVGIIGQLSGIFIIVTVGLTIVGVGFGHSLLIGLIAAFVNIVPYVGPLIGSAVGVLIGTAAHIDLDLYTELLPLVSLIILVFIIVHLIDNFVFQPFIFSSSVKAHPLEIFLVILIAGSLAGVLGMILAIPAYTVLRVFAKEFFNNFKVVKKLTKNIE
jgi:predicted PurR-regulated permease PerM